MSIKRTTVYFGKSGKEHTEETLRVAIDSAKEREIDTVIVSSTTGDTALKALEIFKDSGLKLVVVTHQTGWRAHGVQLMPEETRRKLEEEGVVVVTCTDALAGSVEVGISRPANAGPHERTAILKGRLPYIVPPVTRIIADILRLFCNGMKVCVEIAMMASDTGAIPVSKPVVVVGGTHIGSDTAVVLTPSTSNRVRDLKIHEILVKPI